jgi:hypothetical protein
MTFKKKDSGVILDQGISVNLDYPKLLFWQIDRIARLTTELDARCIKGVDVLEALLTPHHDDEYKAKALEIKKHYAEELKSHSRGGRIDYESRSHLDFEKAMRKFRALMELVSRKNLLPEKEGEYEE